MEEQGYRCRGRFGGRFGGSSDGFWDGLVMVFGLFFLGLGIFWVGMVRVLGVLCCLGVF